MYEIAQDEAWELFGSHLSGARLGIACVVSEQPLDESSRNALNSAVATLGYGRAACTFASLREPPEGPDGAALLDEQALFLLLEGLDPLCLVLADAAAANACARAYRCEVPLGKSCRVFGRTAVAFKSFAAMLADGQDKQVAWALLKKLPRFGER